MAPKTRPVGIYAPFPAHDVVAIMRALKYTVGEPEFRSGFNSPVYCDSHKAPLCLTGFGHRKPGLALKMRGVRIAGINWEPVHYNPRRAVRQGWAKKVEEWHEHVYTDDFGAKTVKAITIPTENTDSLLTFCLRRWNIEARGPLAGQLPGDLFPRT